MAVLLYKTTLYTNMARYSLNKRVIPKMKNYLNESYLFDSSNLDQLTYKFNSNVIVKLKRKSVYNPKDTRTFVDNFIEEYYGTFGDMSYFYYPLRTVNIKFFLKDSENLGPVFAYHNKKLIDKYSEIRENIIKTEAEDRKDKKIEKEMNKAKAKAKRFALKAFGFINFGDTKDETIVKLEHDPRVKIQELMINNPTYKVSLGSYKYNLKPIYKNDKLYLMNFVSGKYQKNQYDDELRQNWQDIIDFYTQIHGETEHSFVTNGMLEENFIEWTSDWKMDKKHIQVGLSQTGVFYHIVIWISHEDYPINKF